MKEILLTTFIIGSKNKKIKNVPASVEIVKYNNILDFFNAKGEYISFIDSEDEISENYFSCILDKINSTDKFDSCFLNYRINYDYERELKIRSTASELDKIIPIKDSYIWSYVFRKETFLRLYVFENSPDYNSLIVEIFNVNTSITDIVYFHNKDGEFINIFNMVNRKKPIYYKNIIYMGGFCNCLFNGYVTWLLEIGKAFKDYPITILYTEINEVTQRRFEAYFECVRFDPSKDYICDSLLVTYSTCFYPINIHSLKQNSLFIHGNMSDYENSARFTDDIFDRYIAVSMVACEKAEGYFPTKNIEYIYNPFVFEKKKVKPHLTLISAFRNAPEKGIDRVKKAASILDSEGIPYTWSIFTDVLEPNQGSLIFRPSITNVIDYIADADYLVQFSRSEALPYSMLEALCANVKIITTDLPAVHELDIVDGKNGIIIPTEYFDDGNEDLLKKKLLEAYEIKSLKFKYNYDYSRYKDYENLLYK